MGKQNRELIKNMEAYEQKKKTEQQESKVYGQKPVKRAANKEKSTQLYNSKWSKSICGMV